MSKDIITTVVEIDKLTESQKDRVDIRLHAFNDMMGFFTTYLAKIKNSNDLKSKAEGLLIAKLIKAEETGEEISAGMLIKIIETMSKAEIDSIVPVLRIIEASVKSTAEKDKDPSNPSSGNGDNAGSNLSESDIKKAKNILDFVNDLEKTEGIKK